MALRRWNTDRGRLRRERENKAEEGAGDLAADHDHRGLVHRAADQSERPHRDMDESLGDVQGIVEGKYRLVHHPVSENAHGAFREGHSVRQQYNGIRKKVDGRESCTKCG